VDVLSSHKGRARRAVGSNFRLQHTSQRTRARRLRDRNHAPRRRRRRRSQSCHAGGSCTVLVHDLLKVVSIWTNNREVFTIGINLPGRFFDRHRAALRQPRTATPRSHRTHTDWYVDVNDVTYGNTERARKADHGRPKCNDPDDKQSGTNQELGYNEGRNEGRSISESFASQGFPDASSSCAP
jgi:hypothetical protein